MAAPQELYAANSGSSSGRSWAGQPTSENVRVQGYNSACSTKSRRPRLPRNPFCLWSRNVLADFFAQGRLVCSWETTYVSRQSDAEDFEPLVPVSRFWHGLQR